MGIVRTQESLDSLLVRRRHKEAEGKSLRHRITSERDFCKFEEIERLFWRAPWELSIREAVWGVFLCIVGNKGGLRSIKEIERISRDSKTYERLMGAPTQIKKKTKFSSYIWNFRWDQVQSHIWGKAS